MSVLKIIFTIFGVLVGLFLLWVLIGFLAYLFSLRRGGLAGKLVNKVFMKEIESYKIDYSWWKTVPSKEVEIKAGEETLVGTVLEKSGSNKVGICVHGYYGNFQDLNPWAKILFEEGHNVIAPDLMAHGKSSGQKVSMGYFDKDDIVLWINKAIEMFGEDCQIVLFGESMGGATVLMTSELKLPKNVKCVIADSAYSNAYQAFEYIIEKLGFLPAFLFLPVANFFSKLPALRTTQSKIVLLTFIFAAAASGLVQLSTTNELRLISGVDKELLSKQAALNAILNPASPAQFFVVEGSSGCDVLSKTAALKIRLDELKSQGITMLAASRFLESCEKQKENRLLASRANARALELLSAATNEKITASFTSQDVLSVQTWQKSVPEALSRTWINSRQAIVLLAGVNQDNVSELSKIADGLANVSFVDTTANIAQSLAYFRDRVLEVLCWATGLVGVVLVVVFRRSFLRLWTPCIAGIALTLGTLGWLNIPLSLFSVLPLILVLGLGVDYAILLNDEKSTTSAGNSVFLAAASTLLAFGLLAFSSTPALHIFGLTLAIALGWVLVLTIALRTRR